MVQKIERLPLREAFKHEAYDFTRWLESNIDVLNDVLDITLSNPEREQSAGDFAIDLVAEDESGGKVIIENQLEKSDHDHLGKLITYAVAMEAKAAVWIVSNPRPEHVSAITWLNTTASTAFYMLKIEAIRIGASEPAPLMTLIVGPTEFAKSVGKDNQEFVARFSARREFWSGLLQYAKTKTKLHVAISPSKYNWIGTGAGRSGLGFNYVVWEHKGAAELYIDRGEEAENKQIFDALHAMKADVEHAFGGELDWMRLDGKRASRIRALVAAGGYKDGEQIPAAQAAMVDAMVRLEAALRPKIGALAISGRD